MHILYIHFIAIPLFNKNSTITYYACISICDAKIDSLSTYKGKFATK